MTLKEPDDLKDSAASIGGAMGTWPFRTLWYVCRWERSGLTDPQAVEAIQQKNNDVLADLSDHAEAFGMDTDTLDRRRDALEWASVDDLRTALERAYTSEFPKGAKCPFEQEGSDMACHRCPVAGQALERLIEMQEQAEKAEVEPRD